MHRFDGRYDKAARLVFDHRQRFAPADPRRLLVASAAAEAESGSSDGGHPVRDVLILLRRHCGKLAATLAAPGNSYSGMPVT
jgi:hypothetical protein